MGAGFDLIPILMGFLADEFFRHRSAPKRWNQIWWNEIWVLWLGVQACGKLCAWN